jgi:anti-sigma regulatory factor (Ser/Thr protein kinase)
VVRGGHPADRGEARRVALPAGPRAASDARAWLAWLRPHAAPDRLDDAMLVATELVTNSVRHAGLTEGAPIELDAAVADGHLRLSVRDRGRGFDPPARLRPPPAEELGHRGLWIVHALAERVVVDRREGRVTVELPRA